MPSFEQAQVPPPWLCYCSGRVCSARNSVKAGAVSDMILTPGHNCTGEGRKALPLTLTLYRTLNVSYLSS